MTGYRLKEGGAIDRAKPVGFSFDGTRLQGFAGDTLASALLANGRQLVARSFKYHRPRGIMSAGLEEASALVTVGNGARAPRPIRLPRPRSWSTGSRPAASIAGPA